MRAAANTIAERAVKAGGTQAMNFDFSDDLEAAARAGAQIPARALPTDHRRGASWRGLSPTTRRSGRRSPTWAGLGAAIPEEYGGAGLGHLGLCVLAEELGSALAPVPFSSSVYLASRGDRCSPAPRRRRKTWLPKLAIRRGDRHVCVGRGPRQGRRSASCAPPFAMATLSGDKVAGARRRCRRRRDRCRAGRARRSRLRSST